jgi:hypothetical protein
MLRGLNAARGPSESHSDTIVRLAAEQATTGDLRLAKHRHARVTGAGA